jgi:hypothetical protein
MNVAPRGQERLGYHVLREVGTDAALHVSQDRAVVGREQLSELPRLAILVTSGLIHQHVYVRIGA